MQFKRGTRILRVIHGRDARATSANRTRIGIDFQLGFAIKSQLLERSNRIKGT